MVKWSILAVLGVFISIGTFLFFRLGVYKSVKLEQVENVELRLLYKSYQGPYHKILSTIQDIEALAKTKDIPCTKTFGEFLDDPKTKEENNLQANAGCFLELDPVKTEFGENVHYRKDPPGKYLKATFEGSPAIGPFKVYPKALDWFQKEDRTFSVRVIEVYQINEDQSMLTEYYFPLQ